MHTVSVVTPRVCVPLCVKKTSAVKGLMAPCLVPLWSLCQQIEITAVRRKKGAMHLPPLHNAEMLLLCVGIKVCEAKGCRRLGVPVIKSSLRADQDPVNQTACERMRAP